MVLHSPSPLRAVKRGPNPQKWPDNMQRKKTHPTSNMNGVGMRMITFYPTYYLLYFFIIFFSISLSLTKFCKI